MKFYLEVVAGASLVATGAEVASELAAAVTAGSLVVTAETAVSVLPVAAEFVEAWSLVTAAGVDEEFVIASLDAEGWASVAFTGAVSVLFSTVSVSETSLLCRSATVVAVELSSAEAAVTFFISAASDVATVVLSSAAGVVTASEGAAEASLLVVSLTGDTELAVVTTLSAETVWALLVAAVSATVAEVTLFDNA